MTEPGSGPRPAMALPRSIYRFILRWSWRRQALVLGLTALSLPVYYASLQLPKLIVNALSGKDVPPALLGHPVDQLGYLFVLCGVFLVLVRVFWIGFLGSDDSLYWDGSSGWLTHFPFLGQTHWALRHTLVIPIAIARAVLGDGSPALLAPPLLYAIGVLVVIALWMRRVAGATAAIAASSSTR